jgi:hypothetical protein
VESIWQLRFQGTDVFVPNSSPKICYILLEATGGDWSQFALLRRMVSEIGLRLEYSVEADVSPAFAWQFRTDVANWNDPPAQFSLEGPFEAGSRGTTQLPGQQTLHWRICAVRHGESFVTEMQLDRATLTFEWYFYSISEGRTKLTQRIELSGDNVAAYALQVEAGFGSNLPGGMERIAADMVAAEKRSNNADQ